MRIYVDIDDTICYREDKSNLDYNKSIPLPEKIAKINQLFDQGHEIYYWTARGTSTRINWLIPTQNQLDSWGCKYHGIKVFKPNYDLFICDKALNSINAWDKIDDFVNENYFKKKD